MPVNILKEPRNMEYERLLQYAFEICSSFVLSVRKEILSYYPEPEIFKRLEPYLIKKLAAPDYQQIQCYSSDLLHYFYECSEATQSIILPELNGLYEWREPFWPEDLTFLKADGQVWLGTISHEHMGFISETHYSQVEFLKNEIGLEIYWMKRTYSQAEVENAINTLFSLIDEYFNLLGSHLEEELRNSVKGKKNSQDFGFWEDCILGDRYNISEHCLAFEIARFSNLLKLEKAVYAYDFFALLDEGTDTGYLEELLAVNISGHTQVMYDCLESFKARYRTNRKK